MQVNNQAEHEISRTGNEMGLLGNQIGQSRNQTEMTGDRIDRSLEHRTNPISNVVAYQLGNHTCQVGHLSLWTENQMEHLDGQTEESLSLPQRIRYENYRMHELQTYRSHILQPTVIKHPGFRYPQLVKE